MDTRNASSNDRKAELDEIVRERRKREAMEIFDAAGLSEIVKAAVASAMDEQRAWKSGSAR